MSLSSVFTIHIWQANKATFEIGFSEDRIEEWNDLPTRLFFRVFVWSVVLCFPSEHCNEKVSFRSMDSFWDLRVAQQQHANEYFIQNKAGPYYYKRNIWNFKATEASLKCKHFNPDLRFTAFIQFVLVLTDGSWIWRASAKVLSRRKPRRHRGSAWKLCKLMRRWRGRIDRRRESLRKTFPYFHQENELFVQQLSNWWKVSEGYWFRLIRIWFLLTSGPEENISYPQSETFEPHWPACNRWTVFQGYSV